ncbi:MAG TPA: adenylate kinase [Acidimicrobiales bacterium]|jgi:adenylate kinase|nr:adenylate kinase [Acidimicrobiales bacterium]
MSRRLVILGKQGAGKGTQADRLADNYGVPRISTGDIFRTAVKEGTEAGKKARSYMESGDLVPDDVVVEVVRERLGADDAQEQGFILDGFPRNVRQAEALDKILGDGGVDLVLELVVPTDVVLERLAGRRVCKNCGTNYSVDRPPKNDWKCDRCDGEVVEREDDTKAAITRRLDLYERETEPLVAWYMAKDKLAAVDGTGDPDVVTTRLQRAVDSRLRALAARQGQGQG